MDCRTSTHTFSGTDITPQATANKGESSPSNRPEAGSHRYSIARHRCSFFNDSLMRWRPERLAQQLFPPLGLRPLELQGTISCRVTGPPLHQESVQAQIMPSISMLGSLLEVSIS
jgi:hypothetical protein